MCEFINVQGISLTEEESYLQDQKTEKVLKFAVIILSISTGIVLIFPLLSHAQTLVVKSLPVNQYIEYNGESFQKLFTQIDYRDKKKVVKKIVKKIVQPKNIQNHIQANIEINPFGGTVDLNPILNKLFNWPNIENTVQILELETEQKILVIDKVLSSFQQLKNYLINNQLALIRGGFIGFGLGEIKMAKKGFDLIKNFLDSKEKQKKDEEEKSILSNSLSSVTGLISNPYLMLPLVLVILLKGKLSLPQSAQEFDQLPEPVKPLFKKPSKMKRFVDYYIKPIYNFKSPVPYIIIGSVIVYFNRGQILSFIPNKDQYKTAFGEITSIMMKQLKNQFSEFVNFVKNTNSVFVEQMRTTQKEYSENIKDTTDTLKENILEQKAYIKEKDHELKVCNNNKEKLLLGYQECSLKYQYARDYFEQSITNSNSISIGVDENAKQQTQRILPLLTQDVTFETINPENGKKKK